MGKAGALVAGVAGLLMSGLGLIIGIAFALPALGLNVHGSNSLGFTIVVEAIAVALYLLGAGLCWYAGHQVRKLRNVSVKGLVPAGLVMVTILLLTAAGPVLRSDWTAVVISLVFAVGLLLPLVLGLQPWKNSKGEGATKT